MADPLSGTVHQARTRVDVAVIGGGMVGASLAAALCASGVSVMLVEEVSPGTGSQPSFDDRTTALGNASRRIFQQLGVWEAIAREAGVIRQIHVSEAGRFGFARLSAAEQGIEAFGYVASNRVIGGALWQKLQSAPRVLLRTPARLQNIRVGAAGVELEVVPARGPVSPAESVDAQLVVAADGAQSMVRAAVGIQATVEEYDQVAIVANVSAELRSDGTAYERFTSSGPLAVLPLHDGSFGVIWTCAPARAAEILACNEGDFLAQLQERFGWRVGRFVRAGSRSSYPLRLTRATAMVAQRTVLIGNAAQALHPVAGQGFNLGLRDAAMLAEIIAEAHRSSGDVGAGERLQRFAAGRAGDRRGVVRFTDGLIRLFGDKRFGMLLARNLGLLLFDLTPPAKRALARVSIGFAGPTPRLARGLDLE